MATSPSVTVGVTARSKGAMHMQRAAAVVTQACRRSTSSRAAGRRSSPTCCSRLGLSFGFVAVVAAVAHASWFRLPAGVADRDYVSLGRESVDGAFHGVSLADAPNIAERVPELAWFYHKRLPDTGGPRSIRLPHGTPSATWLSGRRASVFSILGVQAHVGRLDAPAQGQPAAVLSHALCSDVYGADADIVGELLHVVDGASVPLSG